MTLIQNKSNIPIKIKYPIVPVSWHRHLKIPILVRVHHIKHIPVILKINFKLYNYIILDHFMQSE